MSDSNEQLYRVLKEHYILGKTQREIAASEGLSTATISRLIKEGFKRGYVKITLNLPDDHVPELETVLLNKYHLNHVSVIKTGFGDKMYVISRLASLFEEYFDSILQDHSIVCLGWGRTLYAISQHLNSLQAKDLCFVSMNGGVESRHHIETGALQVLINFSKAYHATYSSLPLPYMVGSKKLAQDLLNDQSVRKIFESIHRSDIAVFSIGGLIKDSLLLDSEYYTAQKYQELREEGYVGEIASRFYKRDGSHDNNDLYGRTIGITLEELKKKKHKICIVTDPEKSEALKGALSGGYIDALFIDQDTAASLIDDNV